MKTHRPRGAWKRWLEDWSVDGWLRWIDRQQDRLVRIDNVVVDGRNLFERRFACEPSTCTRGRRAAGYRSCCADLSVELTEAERRDLWAWWPEIRETLGRLDRTFDPDTPFEELVEEGADLGLTLAKRRGRCALSFLDGEGIRCGVHAAALERGFDRHAVQPRSCSIFPLMLVELPGGRFLLSAYDLDADGPTDFSESANLPCLEGKRGEPLYASMGDTLTHLFGARFYEALSAEGRRWGRRAGR